MAKRILIDTNILLESLLDQENAEISESIVDSNVEKFITSFSINSIAIISKKYKVSFSEFDKYLKFLFLKCKTLNLENKDIPKVYKIAEEKELDFDDAHIYYLAKKNKLKIVTFDKHLLKFKAISINANTIL